MQLEINKRYAPTVRTSQRILSFRSVNNARLLFTDADFFLLKATSRNSFRLSCITKKTVWPEGTMLVLA